MAACFTPWYATLFVGLGHRSYLAIETYLMKLYQQRDQPQEVCDLKVKWSFEVIFDSAESWWPMQEIRLSVCWSHLAILLDLSLCAWVDVIPNCYCFDLKPPTVDCGIFNSQEALHCCVVLVCSLTAYRLLKWGK